MYLRNSKGSQTPLTTLTKDKGKHLPIVITPEVRNEVSSFKKRLEQMAEYEDETSYFDVKTIEIILNELDDYDRNILLAFYSCANCSSTILGKLLGISSSVAGTRVKSIQKKIKKLNNVPKTIHNPTRCNPDC